MKRLSKILLPHILVLCTCVVVVASCGGGGASEPQQDIPLNIDPPQDVTATASSGQVELSWSNSNASFDLYVATEANLNFMNYTTFDNSELVRDVSAPYVFTPPNLNYEFFFTIVAKRDGRESDQSEIVSAVPKFESQGDTVIDFFSDVVWKKCAIGQTYNSSSDSCSGEAVRLTLEQAQAQINNVYPGWRLPTLDELHSIIYCSDGIPSHFLESSELTCDIASTEVAAIYANVFPNASIGQTPMYWSSTTRMVDGVDETLFWVVNFRQGRRETTQSRSVINVRLVRDRT